MGFLVKWVSPEHSGRFTGVCFLALMLLVSKLLMPTSQILGISWKKTHISEC